MAENMETMALKTVKAFGIAILCSSLFSCTPQPKLPYYHTEDLSPIWIDKQALNLDTLHDIHDFSFTNQYGNPFGSEDIKGKIKVCNFFFTACPGICPKMMHHLHNIQEAFPNDAEIIIYSHSVTPEMDSVPVLLGYAERNKIEGNWHLLTGDRKAINELGRQSYLIGEDILPAGDKELIHTEKVILIDKQNHIRGVYNGTLALEIQRLIGDIQVLKLED
jgi:protein SCO1